jgi:hypothetical protein
MNNGLLLLFGESLQRSNWPVHTGPDTYSWASRVSLLGSGDESGHDGSIFRAISSKEREMPDVILRHASCMCSGWLRTAIRSIPCAYGEISDHGLFFELLLS